MKFRDLRVPISALPATATLFNLNLSVGLVQGAGKAPHKAERVDDLAVTLSPGLIRHILRDRGPCFNRLLEGRIYIVGVQVKNNRRSVQRGRGMYTAASQHCAILSSKQPNGYVGDRGHMRRMR